MDLSGGRRNLKCGCCGKLDTASLVMTNESNEWKKVRKIKHQAIRERASITVDKSEPETERATAEVAQFGIHSEKVRPHLKLDC